MYLELGELHVTVLNLICSHNSLERVNQFLRVVPLHARGAQYDCRLFRARCLRVDSCSFEMLALRLFCSHQASLIGDSELHASGDHWARRHPFLSHLERGRAH